MVSRSRRGLYAVAVLLTGILGLIALGSGPVFGQSFSAALSGVVRDATGSVVPDAAITVRNTETGLTRTAQTGANGGFTVPSLPVGPYELTVEKPGFKQQVRMGINLSVGQEAAINFTLEVGNVQQTVEVTGEAPLVNTTLASVSGLVTDEQIKDMPLNGRSFSELLLLNTNTSDNRSNTAAGGPSFSVAGKRTETNRWTINGVDYYGDNSQGTEAAPQGMSGQLLGVDAVREYNVLGHTYGAEYGKRAGGQITVVTSSGTNQLHGTAFAYLRNNHLDARNFFSDTEGAPPFKRNQLGGSLGGPIMKDKMFIFGNYEGFRERLEDDTVSIVPNADARRGLMPCNAVTSLPAQGVFPAYTKPPCTGSELINVNTVPRMLDFFRYWPAPNGKELGGGAAESYSHPWRPVNEDFGLARYDYSVTSRDSLSTNFTVDRGRRLDPQDNPIMINRQSQQLYTLGGQETHIFSPTVLMLANFGWSRASAGQSATPNEPFPDNTLLMAGGDRSNAGAVVIGGGTSTAQASTFTSANGQNPINSYRQNFSGSDDLRMTIGRHNLSMGVWFMKIQQRLFSSVQNNAGTVTYPTLLAMLQDRPTQFQAGPNPTPLNFRQTEAAWYFQDEIKLRPNLTVRLGIRDEMTTGWNEKNGISANYGFDPNGVIQSDAFIGHSSLLENNAIALWQPRVGVAWAPGGSGRWSVRAGFGIHNDLLDNLGNRMNANPPFNGRVQIANTPLLSIIPLASNTPPAPRCQTVGQTNPPCTTYGPGGVEPTLHTPTIQEWSLEVERGITQDLAVEVSYVGNQAYHLSSSMDMNTRQPVKCDSPAGCRGGTVPQGTDYILPNTTRPNPLVGSTQTWMYLGNSSYHSGSVSLTKRARAGLTFKANYTFSKVLDMNSAILSGGHQNEGSTVLNRYNLKLSKGIASYSVAHRSTTNFSYQLPFGQGKAIGGGASGWVEKVIGGWQWNGILNVQSGFPISPLVGSNNSGNGDARNPDVPNRNPEFKGNPILGVDEFKKTGRYFDPNAFLLPPAGTFGNVGRGVFFGPGLLTVNTSFFKRIPLTERWNLQFRTEIFNLFNHANFDTPELISFSGTAGSDAVCRGPAAGRPNSCFADSAGVIRSTSTRERQIQFALRLEF